MLGVQRDDSASDKQGKLANARKSRTSLEAGVESTLQIEKFGFDRLYDSNKPV